MLRSAGLQQYSSVLRKNGFQRREDLFLASDATLHSAGVHIEAHRLRLRALASLEWHKRLAAAQSSSSLSALALCRFLFISLLLHAMIAVPWFRSAVAAAAVTCWLYGRKAAKYFRLHMHSWSKYLFHRHEQTSRVNPDAADLPNLDTGNDGTEDTELNADALAPTTMSAELEQDNCHAATAAAKDDPTVPLLANVDLSEGKHKKLEELRHALRNADINIPDEMKIGRNEDAVFIRFLQARHWDAEKAAALLKETIAWRTDRGEGKMLGEDPSEHMRKQCLSRYELGFYGFDSQYGRPITLERLGASDVPGLAKVLGGSKHVIDMHVRYMEVATRVMMEEASRRNGYVTDKMCLLMDLQGTTMRLLSKANLHVFSQVMYIDSHYYPVRP